MTDKLSLEEWVQLRSHGLNDNKELTMKAKGIEKADRHITPISFF
jgi:hypothetical protein